MDKKFLYVVDPNMAEKLKECGYPLLKETDSYWIFLNESNTKIVPESYELNQIKGSNVLTF